MVYNFSQPKQPAMVMLQDTPLFGRNDIMDNLFSKEDIPDGGAIISELLKEIKSAL